MQAEDGSAALKEKLLLDLQSWLEKRQLKGM